MGGRFATGKEAPDCAAAAAPRTQKRGRDKKIAKATKTGEQGCSTFHWIARCSDRTCELVLDMSASTLTRTVTIESIVMLGLFGRCYSGHAVFNGAVA